MAMPGFMRLFVQDYMADPKVRMLTLEEQGAYLNLLFNMWIYSANRERCELPDRPESIARLLGIRPRRWLRLRAALVEAEDAVLQTVDGFLFSPRLQQEFEYMRGRSESARASVNTRWQRSGEDEGSSGTGSGPSGGGGGDAKTSASTPAAAPAAPAPAPVVSPFKRKSGKSASPQELPADPLFEEAWAAYPKRSGSNPKIDARRCWAARLAEGVDPAEMLDGVHRYRAYALASGKEGTEYIMQATRFFGRSRLYAEPYTYQEPPQALTKAELIARHNAAVGREWLSRERQPERTDGSRDEVLAHLFGLDRTAAMGHLMEGEAIAIDAETPDRHLLADELGCDRVVTHQDGEGSHAAR